MNEKHGREADRGRVFLAFRFHVNFYHSYRGDSLDETGIGPDIRIIRGILDDLDALESEGLSVCGTWDIENYYSLEEYMPRHAPDLVERIASRVRRGLDEVEVMSYNNGIAAAHSEVELDRAIGWAISNPMGSGLRDLFGTVAPVARPQECMTSPSHPPVYRNNGVEALSIYYSSLPFNGFSNFVPPLPLYERHNPLSLDGPGGSITLLPCFNHGDIADSGASLRRWVRRLRRAQLRGRVDGDLILLIDMDADDEFWQGIRIPLVPRLFPSFAGLSSLARSVADLRYVEFTTPGRYLADHPPVASISFGQDTADGSFDGFASWAEKAENAAVWTKVHRARTIWEAAELVWRIERAVDEIPEPLSRALTTRILAMSTTHFGLASPVMNANRLNDAHRWADRAVTDAREALTSVAGLTTADTGAAPTKLVFDPEIDGLPPGRGSLVAIGADLAELLGGFGLPWSVHQSSAGSGEGSGFRMREGSGAATVDDSRGDHSHEDSRGSMVVLNPSAAVTSARDVCPSPVSVSVQAPRIVGSPFARKLETDHMRVRFGERGDFEIEATGLPAVSAAPVWVRYDGTVRRACAEESLRFSYAEEGAPHGVILCGTVPIDADHALQWRRAITVVPSLSAVYVDCEVRYPLTEDYGFDRRKARRLARGWDARWQEVAPLEVAPVLSATADEPVRVVKHNFQGAVSTYRIDYHRFGPNRSLPSSNNHITDGWVAFTGPAGGVLLAQSARAQTSFAFCPVRTRMRGERQEVRLNPFGTYTGAQWRYPSARTGLGRRMAMLMADQLDSYAPSYGGHTTRFSLMIAPFAEDFPDEALQRDALVFATPPILVR